MPSLAFKLEISVGVPGQIKNQYIDNPSWELVETNLYLINGVDRRNLRLMSMNDLGEISVIGGKIIVSDKIEYNRAIVSFNNQLFGRPGGVHIEMFDPGSSDEHIVFVEKYTWGNNLRPFKQTVPLNLAAEAVKYFFENGGALDTAEWTTIRGYGG